VGFGRQAIIAQNGCEVFCCACKNTIGGTNSFGNRGIYVQRGISGFGNRAQKDYLCSMQMHT